MRLRFAVLACALTALAGVALPQLANASPHRNQGLTIHATPHNIIAGEAVLIYGRLGTHQSGQLIRLYHRIAPNRRFTIVSSTKTVAGGRYEFTRAEKVVETNRSWFVRGPHGAHSRTVNERVAALVTLAASKNTSTTRHPIIFSGHLTPNHAGSSVLLQEEKGSSDDWRTLKRGRVGAGSNYQIAYGWRTPGARNVRVLFRGDKRNVGAASDAVAVVIQQAQVSSFTINTSDPIVNDDQPATIYGTLYSTGSATAPEPGQAVELFGRPATGGSYKELQSEITRMDGSYSFTVQSSVNEWYQVRTVSTPHRSTAQLFEGVQDNVTMTSSSSVSTVNGHVRFTGSVSPDKAGHEIYLQKLGRDGDWHTVARSVVHSNSTFAFGWTFGTAGVKEFRARITGGPANVGGASPEVTVDVTQPPLSTLPS
jgi:hypothetical protein